MDGFIWQNLVALTQVIIIDIVLAGDNAIIVGLAASRVAPEIRSKVIMWGIGGAVVLRVLFAAVTTQLLAIVGLTLAGGILLLWVCWKMYRELQHSRATEAVPAGGVAASTEVPLAPISLMSAITTIIVADISMSLDNVLAVAGIAKGNLPILVIGLAVSIILMAVAANYIAKLLARYPWFTWVGLAIILYVAADMIWRGAHEVSRAAAGGLPLQDNVLSIMQAVFR